MRVLTRWVWITCFLVSGAALAADESSSAVAGVVPAKLVEQAEAGFGDGPSPQGWVLISRCVDKDGTAADPVVVDSSGIAELERAARRVTRESKYQSATLDGTPIDSCEADLMMQFQNEAGGQTPSDGFAAIWAKAEEFVTEGNADKASRALDEIKTWNTDEGRRLAVLHAEIARLQKDSASQLRWLTTVLNSPGELATKLAADLRRRVFALQVEAKQYARARATYLQLESMSDVTLTEGERTAGEQLKSLPDSKAAFATPARLDARFADDGQPPSWSTALLRRDFAFAEVEGAPERFELRCEHKRYRSPFGTDNQWKVPTSWGTCSVVVFGPADATFKLVEFPPPPAAS